MSTHTEPSSTETAPAGEASVSNEAFTWTKNIPPSEDELRVAANLGATPDTLDKMRQEGMSRAAYYQIATALAAEVHLTGKYGTEFKAIGSTIESDSPENQAVVTLEPQDGPYALPRCDVIISWSEGAPAVFTENYFCIVRAEEYRSYVSELLGDPSGAIAPDVYAAPTLSTTLFIGDEFDESTPIEEVAASCPGNLALAWGPRQEMTEAQYRAELDSVLAKAAEINPRMFFESGYIYALEAGQTRLTAVEAESYLHSALPSRRELCIWRLEGTVSAGVDGASPTT